MNEDFAPARGGKRPAEPLVVEVVRSLGEEDKGLLVAPPPVGATPPTVGRLRSAHHQLAQLLAKGVPVEEVSLITGYSISRISILQTRDPAFGQLLAHYQSERELVFVDSLERLAGLGTSAVEELKDRLEERPGDFSNRELLEIAETALVKTRRGGIGGEAPGGTAGGVSVTVQFVGSGEAGPPLLEGRLVE